jgi:alkylation response protein AidB-like acyl-CoA dehydrogenase
MSRPAGGDAEVRLPLALGERVDVLPVVEWLRPQILAALPAIEQDRRLPVELTDAMFAAGLNHAALPRELGGLELHLLDLLELIFELSRISGSVGWTLVIQNGGDPLLEPEVMRELIDGVDGRWVVSGSHGRIGTARKVEGGYVINGHYAFASGAPWATYLTAAVEVVNDQGEVVTDPDSEAPTRLEALFPKEAVTYLDNWNPMGLRGTGSGEFRADDVFVEDRCVYVPFSCRAYHDRALYRAGFAGTTPAALLGMAQGAIDDFGTLARRPKRTNSYGNRAALLGAEQSQQMSVGAADALVRSAYDWVRELSRRALELSHSDDAQAQEETLMRLLEANTHGAHAARQAVTAIFLAAGSDAVITGRGIERQFRDIHTGGQHTGTLLTTFAEYGRYHLARSATSSQEGGRG